MLAISFIRWLLLAVELCVALPILYLCVVSAASILAMKKSRIAGNNSLKIPEGRIHFAVLIPAHDEETLLGNLLHNLSNLSFPKDLYTVFVIADNCTDNTADLARTFDGVRIFERFDSERRGKGYALSWLIQRIEQEQLIYDAYVILDADSVVNSTFLQSMMRELARGGQAMQAYYGVLNPSTSPSTALRWLALTLVNYVRPLGRTALGGSSTLSGNGMCFSRSLLQRYPWQAFSLTEDYQYYLTLIEHGERVRYVPDAVVLAEMPVTFRQMRTQDIRWESTAGGDPVWQIALRLLKVGLKQRYFTCFEAIAELLTPPLSLLVSASLLVFLVSLLSWTRFELLLSMALLGGLACYIATALYMMHPPRTVYKAFLHAPGFMFWKLWVLFVLRWRKKHVGEWVRTSRTL